MQLHGVLVVEDVISAEGDVRSVPAVEHVANRPIAHHVLDALEAAGVTEVVVASSARTADAVRECLATRERSGGARLQFVQQPAALDFASALALVAPIVAESPCIVHAAGGLLSEPLTPLVNCLNGGPDAVLMVHHAPTPDQRLSAAAQRALRLAELDPNRSALGMAGVWAFGRGAVRNAAGAGDVGGEREGLTQVADRISAAGGTIHVRLADLWRAYRGDADDLLELNQIVLDGIESDVPLGSRETNRIEGRVRIHESAVVTSSVLVGPVLIGPQAHISDAYIGPYTAVGAGAHIEGAEIERSIISSGARITHIGCRMTASVVSRNARVYRDFSLPRALKLRVGDGGEVGFC
jgi:glucose-1-phosphate thymidylyltransferase